MAKLKKMLKAALFGSVVSFVSHAATVDQVCSQVSNKLFDKSFANIFLVLDYSGSMEWPVYNNGYNYYNHNKIYFGYFDPFAIYKLKYLGNYPIWEKTDKCSFWEDCYTGNYLNWYYTSRIDLERLILTGGKTRYLTQSYGIIYLVYEIKSDIWNQWLQRHPRLEKHLKNWFEIEIDEQNGIVRLKRPLMWPMAWMCSYLNRADVMKNFVKHRACHFLPSRILKYACLNNEMNIYCSADVKTIQGERVIVLEKRDQWGNIHKTYLKLTDSITYNPQTENVEGLLQKMETFNVKPRIGAILFSSKGNGNIAKAWIYPTYEYANLITTINKIEPDGATPTGAALNEVKNYFALNNGTFDTFTTTDADYINPYKFTVNNQTYTVEDTKNSVVLVSDGAWNGYRYYRYIYVRHYNYEPYKVYKGQSVNYGDNVCDKGGVLVKNPLELSFQYACAIDPVIPVYEMWKAGQADLANSIPGNQNADTYAIGAFMDDNSLGANALKNIALYGSTQDNSTYYYTPPKPACDAYHSPYDWGSCGSFIYPPDHINTNENPPHYYNAKDGLKLYVAIYKVLNNKMQELLTTACADKVVGFPNYSLHHMVTTLLTEINQNIYNYDPQEVKEFVRNLVELEKEDLAPILGNTNNLDTALAKIDQSTDIESLKDAINNAISTIYITYNQAVTSATEAYISQINKVSSLSKEEAEKILKKAKNVNLKAAAELTAAVLEHVNQGRDDFIFSDYKENLRKFVQTLKVELQKNSTIAVNMVKTILEKGENATDVLGNIYKIDKNAFLALIGEAYEIDKSFYQTIVDSLNKIKTPVKDETKKEIINLTKTLTDILKTIDSEKNIDCSTQNELENYSNNDMWKELGQTRKDDLEILKKDLQTYCRLVKNRKLSDQEKEKWLKKIKKDILAFLKGEEISSTASSQNKILLWLEY